MCAFTPPRWNGSNWSKEAIRAALVMTDRRLT
jgi:hypothetical protein